MIRVICVINLLLLMCGCAGPSRVGHGEERLPPGYALFSITLHCDELDADFMPTVEDMVEMELAGEPYLPSDDAQMAPDGWGVPFDACSTLLETIREGSDDLLPTARYERAQGF